MRRPILRNKELIGDGGTTFIHGAGSGKIKDETEIGDCGTKI